MELGEWISIVCLVTILVVTIVLIMRDSYVQKECKQRFDSVAQQINKINNARHEIDQTQTRRLNDIEDATYYVQSRFVPKDEIKNKIITDNLVANRLSVDDENANDLEVRRMLKSKYLMSKAPVKKYNKKCMMIEPFSNNFSIKDGVATYDSLAIRDFTTDTLNITKAEIDNTEFDNLQVLDNAVFKSINAPAKSSFKDVEIRKGNFSDGTIVAGSVLNGTFNGAKVTNSPIDNATLDEISLQGAKVDSATIGRLNVSDKAKVDDLFASGASIDQLTAARINMGKLTTNEASGELVDYNIVKANDFYADETNTLTNLDSKLTNAGRVVGSQTAYFDKINAKTVETDQVAATNKICIGNANTCIDTAEIKKMSQGRQGKFAGGISEFNQENINTQFPGPDGYNYIGGNTTITKPTVIKGGLYTQDTLEFAPGVIPTVKRGDSSYSVKGNVTQLKAKNMKIGNHVELNDKGLSIANKMKIDGTMQFGNLNIGGSGITHRDPLTLQTYNVPVADISPAGHMQLKGDLTFASSISDRNWSLSGKNESLDFIPLVGGVPEGGSAMSFDKAGAVKTKNVNAKNFAGDIDTNLLEITDRSTSVKLNQNQLTFDKVGAYSFNAPVIDAGPIAFTGDTIYTKKLCFDKDTCLDEQRVKTYLSEGPRGVTGDIGPKGIKGPIGFDGERGPQGIQGPVGERGPTGQNLLEAAFTLYAPKGVNSGGPITFTDKTDMMMQQPGGFALVQEYDKVPRMTFASVAPNNIAFSTNKKGVFEDHMTLRLKDNSILLNGEVTTQQGIQQKSANKVWFDHNKSAGIEQQDEYLKFYAPYVSLATTTPTAYRDILQMDDTKATLLQGDFYVQDSKLGYDDIKKYKTQGMYTKEPVFDTLWTDNVCVQDQCMNKTEWTNLMTNFDTYFSQRGGRAAAPPAPEAPKQTTKKQDCVVEWGPWGVCDPVSCKTVRQGTIKQTAQNNGTPCPPLSEEKPCDCPSKSVTKATTTTTGPFAKVELLNALLNAMKE